MVWELCQNCYCERLKGAWQSSKTIKKFCKSEFFTGLLRQLLRNFPLNDVKTILLLLLSFILFSKPAIADPEIAESFKCSKLFPYFEKKFNIPSNTLHSIALKESGKNIQPVKLE